MYIYIYIGTRSTPTVVNNSTQTPPSGSQLLKGLIVGLAGAVLILLLIIFTITSVSVVLMRRHKSSSISSPIHEPITLQDNDAYGKVQMNTLPSCGHFVTPSLSPNAAYGVMQQYPNMDSSNNYELVETIRSYAEPLPPSLAV